MFRTFAAIAVFVFLVCGVFHPKGVVPAVQTAVYSVIGLLAVVAVVAVVAFTARRGHSYRAGRIAAPKATANPTPTPGTRAVWPMPPVAETQHTSGAGYAVAVTADGAHSGEDATTAIYLLTDSGVTTVTNGTNDTNGASS